MAKMRGFRDRHYYLMRKQLPQCGLFQLLTLAHNLPFRQQITGQNDR